MYTPLTTFPCLPLSTTLTTPPPPPTTPHPLYPLTFLFTSFESCTYRELNHQPLDSQSTFLSTRLPGHQLGNHLIFLNMITRLPLANLHVIIYSCTFESYQPIALQLENAMC